MWGPNKSFIVAVMTRDSGEILIVQRLDATKPEDALPRAIVAGDRISYDVDPATGVIVYAVLNFQLAMDTTDIENVPEQFIKDGKIVIPFEHAIGLANPDNPSDAATNGPMFQSPNNAVAFDSIVLSPDGKSVAFTTGRYEGDGNFVPAELVVGETRVATPDGPPSVTRILSGEIFEPSWHPDNRRLVFVRREAGGQRAILTINRDGTRETPISREGSFSTPKFSPQLQE
jgi:hypothetical protein